MKRIFRNFMVCLGMMYSSVLYSAEEPKSADNEGLTQTFYEIRNYHYDQSKFDAYREWAIHEASPFLRANLDVVGIWVGSIATPEITGTSPMNPSLGVANVTWIMRWDSMEARAKAYEEVFGGEEWLKIWANHPDQKGYLHVEVKLAKDY